MDKYHLSEGKFCTLIVLHQHPEGVSPSVLSEKIGVTRASVSTMIHKLEEQRLVEVRKAEKDGRGKLVGLLLMYKGNDVIQMGMEKKEGILTAEQVKMSFDSVNGRLVNLAVKEGDEVKTGDIVMELDSTDTDLAIEKLEAQIVQIDAQIRSTSGSQAVNYLKADNDETQSFR